MRRKTILVVDDDPELRLALEIRLRANGYDVAFAADGAGSITAAKEHAPDLILLDLGLPAGDGYSVIEALRADRATTTIPVVVLSARDRQPNWNRSLQSGAFAFLQKPTETTLLLTTVRRALGERQKKSGGPDDVIEGSEEGFVRESAVDTMMSRILGSRLQNSR